MKRTVMKMLVSLVLALLAVSCAPAPVSLSMSRQLAGLSHAKYNKVLVVGASAKLERRQIFEEVFVEELKRHGIDAVPSYLVVNTGEALSSKNLGDAAHRSGADCVLITGLVDIKKELKVEPGSESVMFKPVTVYPGSEDWNPRYEIGYAETVVREPPTVIPHLKVSLETKLFDVSTARMVWYGLTTSGEVENLKKATAEFADVIIKALTKDRML